MLTSETTANGRPILLETVERLTTLSIGGARDWGLVVGCWLLVVGSWRLVVGYWDFWSLALCPSSLSTFHFQLLSFDFGLRTDDFGLTTSLFTPAAPHAPQFYPSAVL